MSHSRHAELRQAGFVPQGGTLGKHGRERSMSDYASSGSMGAVPAPAAFGKSTAWLIGAAFACASLCAYAGDDLLSLYQEARVGNPTLRQAQANYQAVQEHKPEALANLLPNISVQASKARVHQDQVVNFGGGGTPGTSG
ncbi:MAG TPA: hypothetical protein VFL97_04595, partial [Nitrococcus sp.]|nr:hypothetical protein [Nitrococcus sp.]